MILQIFHYKTPIPVLNLLREGLLIETENGWGEVAPLPGYSQESLDEAILQLKALQRGEKPTLLPSVAFGLFSCTQAPLSWPASGLLMGSYMAIFEQAEKFKHLKSAKLKVKNLALEDAVAVAKDLKAHFHLRIDVERKWSLAQALTFCSHFKPDDFDYIEDPVSDPKDLVHFPFPLGIDALQTEVSAKALVWKPTVKGVPKASANLVLSSAFESGIGIGKLVCLAHTLKVPPHPIGLGTYSYLSECLLEEPLFFSNGDIHVPTLKPNLKYVRQL